MRNKTNSTHIAFVAHMQRWFLCHAILKRCLSFSLAESHAMHSHSFNFAESHSSTTLVTTCVLTYWPILYIKNPDLPHHSLDQPLLATPPPRTPTYVRIDPDSLNGKRLWHVSRWDFVTLALVGVVPMLNCEPILGNLLSLVLLWVMASTHRKVRGAKLCRLRPWLRPSAWYLYRRLHAHLPCVFWWIPPHLFSMVRRSILRHSKRCRRDT